MSEALKVVPYIGTWIETNYELKSLIAQYVVPYIGTWIETFLEVSAFILLVSYLI